MAKVKLNNSENYESIGVIKLSKETTPIAYNNKVTELINYGVTKEEAEKIVNDMEFELELYYDIDNGLFCVESDAVENGAEIYSPYTGEKCDDTDDDDDINIY